MNHKSAIVVTHFVGWEIECSECGLIDIKDKARDAKKVRKDHVEWHVVKYAQQELRPKEDRNGHKEESRSTEVKG